MDGNSKDIHGNLINIEDYFKLEGELVNDYQRISVYTKMLAKNVGAGYLHYNVVLASHLLAFTAYKCLENEMGLEDVFELLKYKEKDVKIDITSFRTRLYDILKLLKEMESKEEIIIENNLKKSIDDIIQHGLKNLGAFHVEKVLYVKKDYVKTEDFGLLYYYSNRLSFLNDKL
ncbi:MAG: hypothetical protein R2771_05535 [Saprospiraceae bacterium]